MGRVGVEPSKHCYCLIHSQAIVIVWKCQPTKNYASSSQDHKLMSKIRLVHWLSQKGCYNNFSNCGNVKVGLQSIKEAKSKNQLPINDQVDDKVNDGWYFFKFLGLQAKFCNTH
jgi:hypothetical protein